MEMQISLKESPYDFDYETDYSTYGFDVKRVCDLKGNETDFKAVVNTKTGEIIAFRGNKYKLLPNEVVLEASKQIADELGLVPFKTIGEATMSWRKWKSANANKIDTTKMKKYNKTLVQEFINEPHAILDSTMTKMMALYVTPKVYDMDTKDKMQFGILVKNSIDGSTNLSVEGFSFRSMCTNVSMYSASNMAKHGLISGYKMRHMKNVKMDFARLKEVMGAVATRTLDMKEVYGKWMVEDVRPNTIKALGKAVPKNYLPEYIDTSGKTAVMKDGFNRTAWEVYNAVTDAAWHRPIEIERKEMIFSGLHEAFFAHQR